MEDIAQRLQLNDCAQWIHQNGYKRIVVELKQDDMKDAAIISRYLDDEFNRKDSIEGKDVPEIYITKSNSCSVDLVVTQHITDIDAIIHIGQVCLTKPQVKNQDVEPTIFFALGRNIDLNSISKVDSIVLDKISSLVEKNPDCRICIFYDTSLIDHARSLRTHLESKEFADNCEVANLHKVSENWFTSECHSNFFTQMLDDADDSYVLGPFITKKCIKEYSHGIYIGDRLSISMTLSFCGSLYQIRSPGLTPVIEEIESRKVLNKRIALIDQIKNQEELKIGVILTNPLANVPSVMERMHSYSKQRRHTLYFITMIQTIDECKIGNFDLCDAFVIINSCSCSTIMESLFFNRPIISELEFKLACGFEVEYGNVLWPGTSTHLTEDDMINRRKVSDVSMALVHTRNELLERCSTARLNKWSGLDYDKASQLDDDQLERLNVEEGLHGLASSYASEPSIEKKEN